MLQKDGLTDMERTLVRNLSDHRGNNLLHCVARCGHAHLLPWLAARLGSELEPALTDENKQGLTPVVLAVKVNPNKDFWDIPTVRELVISRYLNSAQMYDIDNS